jgi:hypothetical protein
LPTKATWAAKGLRSAAAARVPRRRLTPAHKNGEVAYRYRIEAKGGNEKGHAPRAPRDLTPLS